MILHLLRMRRNVNRNVFNGRKNVSATPSLRLHKKRQVRIDEGLISRPANSNKCTLHALPFADDSDRPSIITRGDDIRSEIADDTADQSTSERPLDFECLHSKGLNFIHLIMRSLLQKLDDLRNTKVALIGITESWLEALVTDSEIDIADCNIIRRDRNREGGDVCIYIRRYLIFKQRDDIVQLLKLCGLNYIYLRPNLF